MMRKTGACSLTHILAAALCCVLVKPVAAVGSVSDPATARLEQTQTLSRLLKDLAGRIDPSPEQQRQIELIVLSEAPTGLMLVGEMLANRYRLLDLTRGDGIADQDGVAAIADAQGKLLTRLILWKEGVKARIRLVLTPEQQASLDAWLENMHQKALAHLMDQFDQ